MNPSVIILRTAGTNCDQETVQAFKELGCDVDCVHVNKLIAKKVDVLDYQILAIPGGFSYGDDISAGKILANEMKYKLRNSLKEFVASGRLVLGICNGFQVLVKTGLLPGLDGVIDEQQYTTLTLNNSDKFECRWVHLKKVNNTSPFLKYLPEIIKIPSAHAEGKFLTLNDNILKQIEDNKLVAFRYSDENGNEVDYPRNPNGAVNAIAGICNKAGNVLGMMPHPERAFNIWQTPDWTDKKNSSISEFADGYYLFKSAVEYAEQLIKK
ncbi:MAG: phosphoribosylformylglycinamidine synthase subunit PurQ [bacterium]|nr:phosphoribosylformylglycinamidine synthase subunit PurQ [bacterium]